MIPDKRPCYLRAGQKVTFVGKGGYMGYQALGLAVPTRGNVYTVRGVYLDPKKPGIVGIRLVEFTYPINPTAGVEFGFWHGEFKPLEVRKTDISIFTKMLRPVMEDA